MVLFVLKVTALSLMEHIFFYIYVKILHMNYIQLSTFANFIKEIDQLVSAISKSKMIEEDTRATLTHINDKL